MAGVVESVESGVALVPESVEGAVSPPFTISTIVGVLPPPPPANDEADWPTTSSKPVSATAARMRLATAETATVRQAMPARAGGLLDAGSGSGSAAGLTAGSTAVAPARSALPERRLRIGTTGNVCRMTVVLRRRECV